MLNYQYVISLYELYIVLYRIIYKFDVSKNTHTHADFIIKLCGFAEVYIACIFPCFVKQGKLEYLLIE